ncbi:MAG TPA: hypothetical protein VHO84_14660 [Syntrophorhabdaceae bacterium]|nr:hypothetical protein [Syntrophorhabdaceae bacterium]
MTATNHGRSITLLILAFVTLVAGIIFIQQGVSKYMLIKRLAATEKVTAGLTEEQIKRGEFVDSLRKMQTAGDLIRGHRQKIAPTYNELLGSGKYNPADPRQLTYSQAINLENYLYLGALSFGITYLMMGVGLFMVLTSVSIGIISSYLWTKQIRQ